MPLIIASFSGLYGYGRVFDTGTIISTVKGSQYLNGDTSYMIVANTNEFRMSTVDFTVEWFQNIQYLNSLPRLFSIGNFPNPSFSVSFSTFISSTTDISFPNDPIFVWPSTSSTITPVSDVIDGLSTTSYKNIVKYGSGYIIRPLSGASIVTQLAFTTAGNLPECDPMTFTLEGTNDTISLASPQVTPTWVDSSLIFFLPFNGDASTAATYTDAGPNRNNITRQAGSLATIGGRIAYNSIGLSSSALRLARTTNSFQNITYAAWVYLPSNVTNWSSVLFSGNGGSVCGMSFYTSPANNMRFFWQDNYWGQQSNVSVSLNTWTHVAIVITPTASFWYKDGALLETKTQTYSAASVVEFTVGCDTRVSDRNFPGYIDDALIALRSYSSAEIASIYANSLTDHTGLQSSNGSPSSFTTSTDLTTLNWTTIVANQPTNCSVTRFTKSFSSTFPNTTVYNAYRLRFPTIRDGATATIVQIGEVEMLGSIVNNYVNVWMNSSIVLNAMTSTLFYDAWSHFALTRSTNTIRLFQNGFQIGSTLTSTINLGDSTNPLLIGTTFDASNIVAPIVSQVTPISISGTTIQMFGTIDSTGGVGVTARGFVWSVTPNPTIALSTRVQETGLFQSGSFSATVSSLLPFTTYYIRAFATNTVGTGYSTQIIFTTDRGTPIVSSISIGEIVNNSSLVIAQILATGGYDVTSRGIAWDIFANPLITLSTSRSEIGIFSQPGFFSTYAVGLSDNLSYYARAFASNILGISYGENLFVSGALYQFTSFTFTNAGATGRNGPTLSQLRSAYSVTEWTQNTNYLNMTTQGFQEWTVPKDGSYSITVRGAQGGNGAGRIGGLGASMSGVFNLSKGQILNLVVGQQGVSRSGTDINSAGSGGGGSFVVIKSTNTPLIVAGGGGGAGGLTNGGDGVTTNNGSSGLGSSTGAGGINGGGGGGAVDGTAGTSTIAGGTGISCSFGAGGGGFFTRGGYNCSGATPLINGESYISGALGGIADTSRAGTEGGFGGGAGVGHRASGGGGWSGGGGDGSSSGGGGGGSHNIGAQQNNISGNNSGNGQIIITLLEPATLVTLDASSITGTTAISGGNVITLGSSATLTLRGVVWSTSPGPTIALTTKVEQSGSFGTGSYSLSLTGLQGGTTYYIRAYVSGTGGLSYGDEKQFTTAPTAPIVVTSLATPISGGSTTVTCAINSTGGATVTTRGICWDTSPNPTIALATKTVESGSFSTGTFTATATGISANTVYIRSYATNSVGTSYGGEITASSIPSGNLLIWLDANDVNTLFTGTSGTTPITTNGTSVTRWADKSGNGNDFTNSSGANLPVYQSTGMNNRPAIYFNISYLRRIMNIQWGECTIIFVSQIVSFLANGLNPGYVSLKPTSGINDWNDAGGLVISETSNSGVIVEVASSSVGNIFESGNSTTAVLPKYVIFGKSVFGNTNYLYRNGVLIGTTTNSTNPSTSPAIALGARYENTSSSEPNMSNNTLNGRICEVFIYNRSLSSSERTTIEAYLASKWGI